VGGRVRWWMEEAREVKDPVVFLSYLAVARGVEPAEEAVLVHVHDGAAALAGAVQRPAGELGLPVCMCVCSGMVGERRSSAGGGVSRWMGARTHTRTYMWQTRHTGSSSSSSSACGV